MVRKPNLDRRPGFMIGGEGEFNWQVGSLYPKGGVGLSVQGKIAVSIGQFCMVMGGVGVGYRHLSATERFVNPPAVRIGTPPQESVFASYQLGVLGFPFSYQKGIFAEAGYKGASNLNTDRWYLHAFTFGAGYMRTLKGGDAISARLFMDIANAEVTPEKRIELGQGGTIADTAMFAGAAFALYWTNVPSLKPKKKK